MVEDAKDSVTVSPSCKGRLASQGLSAEKIKQFFDQQFGAFPSAE